MKETTRKQLAIAKKHETIYAIFTRKRNYLLFLLVLLALLILLLAHSTPPVPVQPQNMGAGGETHVQR